MERVTTTTKERTKQTPFAAVEDRLTSSLTPWSWRWRSITTWPAACCTQWAPHTDWTMPVWYGPVAPTRNANDIQVSCVLYIKPASPQLPIRTLRAEGQRKEMFDFRPQVSAFIEMCERDSIALALWSYTRSYLNNYDDVGCLSETFSELLSAVLEVDFHRLLNVYWSQNGWVTWI